MTSKLGTPHMEMTLMSFMVGIPLETIWEDVEFSCRRHHTDLLNEIVFIDPTTYSVADHTVHMKKQRPLREVAKRGSSCPLDRFSKDCKDLVSKILCRNRSAQTQRVREKRLLTSKYSAQNLLPSHQTQPRDTECIEPQPKLTRSGGCRLHECPFKLRSKLTHIWSKTKLLQHRNTEHMWKFAYNLSGSFFTWYRWKNWKGD